MGVVYYAGGQAWHLTCATWGGMGEGFSFLGQAIQWAGEAPASPGPQQCGEGIPPHQDCCTSTWRRTTYIYIYIYIYVFIYIYIYICIYVHMITEPQR